MTLNELLNAIDNLPLEDLDQLQAHINARRQRQIAASDDERLLADIAEILKDAEPVELKAGTMAADKLAAALDAMRQGLSQEERDEIAEAMNAEYIS